MEGFNENACLFGHRQFTLATVFEQDGTGRACDKHAAELVRNIVTKKAGNDDALLTVWEKWRPHKYASVNV